MRFALFPVGAFARFAHGYSLMKTVTKYDEKNIIYEACDCFLGVFYFMRQSWHLAVSRPSSLYQYQRQLSGNACVSSRLLCVVRRWLQVENLYFIDLQGRWRLI
jgi:hypothetical protein